MQDKRIIVVYKEAFKLTNLMLINGRELKHISMFPDMESGKKKKKANFLAPLHQTSDTRSDDIYAQGPRFVGFCCRFIPFHLLIASGVSIY